MMNARIMGYVSLIAMVAGLSSPVTAQDFGIQFGGANTAEVEVEAANDARAIDQEPIDGIVAPAFRYSESEPGVGGPGDIFNVTNIDTYESTVAGNVYSPTLSTENVNKLYVDNTINYLTQTFNTEIFNIKQDVQKITNILGLICQDMEAVDALIGGFEVNGAPYEYLSALGNQCGNPDWSFNQPEIELIANLGFEHGCSDAQASLSLSYRYNGEDVGHSTWSFAHANEHSRGVMYRPNGWVDTDFDGRDDDSYAAYVNGYDQGFDGCEPVREAPIITYVQTETPILLTQHNYNRSKSHKASGNYYRGPDSNPNRDWRVGDYAYYSGVAVTEGGLSIDAKITMLSNDDNAYVSMSVDSHKDNVINIYGDSSSDHKEVDFQIEFLNGDTGDAVSLRSTLTTADLDGRYLGYSYGYSEDVIYNLADITSYSISANSDVHVSTGNGRVRASGRSLNDSGSSGETADQEHWFSAEFEGSSVRFSLSPRKSSSGFGFNGQVMQQNAVVTYPD